MIRALFRAIALGSVVTVCTALTMPENSFASDSSSIGTPRRTYRSRRNAPEYKLARAKLAAALTKIELSNLQPNPDPLCLSGLRTTGCTTTDESAEPEVSERSETSSKDESRRPDAGSTR